MEEKTNLYKCFQRIEKDETFPNYFSDYQNLDIKNSGYFKKGKAQTILSHDPRYRSSIQSISKSNPITD